MQFNMFEFLRNMIATEDGLIIFLLGLIVAMEIIDFFSGTFAAVNVYAISFLFVFYCLRTLFN